MKAKILVVGSTGKLGSKLLSYAKKNKIEIFAITCFKNRNKLSNQIKRYGISNSFILSDEFEKKRFLKFLKQKIDLIYFLDFGSSSLRYIDLFNKFNSNSIVAIANKEMIIAGGSVLLNKLKKKNNKLIPLDSEHYSLINDKIDTKLIDKIYITASGGPFYFNKKINLNKVNLKQVLSHPKWKMGINNLIDSSNFVNKILEIFELSYIYNFPINKIDFLISRDAFVHSILLFKNNIISFNSFKNDMLNTLIYPISFFYPTASINNSSKIFNKNSFQLEKYEDKRFYILKKFKIIKKFTHTQQINFMITNNYVQKLYLNQKINYHQIVPYIFKLLKKLPIDKKLQSIDDILRYITIVNNHYEDL